MAQFFEKEPQAFISSYAPRLRAYNNSLLTPVFPTIIPPAPTSRTTKRGTTAINYAEDGYDDYDEDDDEGRRRPTGLRSLRREDSTIRIPSGDKVGKDATQPVSLQGVWRDWMTKPRSMKTDIQNCAQACLPLTLVPIRIDLDVPSFIPQSAWPTTTSAYDAIDPRQKMGEATLPYRLKDIFLWNLHETLITTDHFAQILVQDLDLPNRTAMTHEISKQIRTQLEEYAGVALHPLFRSDNNNVANAPNGTNGTRAVAAPLNTAARGATPTTQNGGPNAPKVTASAQHINKDSDDFNPDDTYRCVVTLNINLGNHLYTDKFEWSLLHPSGTAEDFARVTCADLGLAGEWVPAMTHAIYESVLRLKKDVCEAGGFVAGWVGANAMAGGEFPNDAALSASGEAGGWRYDPEHLADEWEPKIDLLSKEDMEKREGDRERQIRRLRRETARFSSNAGMAGGLPIGFGFGGLIEQEEERMGRGERSKKKKRFRSLSPLGRSGTPGGRVTPGPANGGYGGGGSLTEQERSNWRCTHCRIWGTGVWAVRDGPYGVRSLCNNCGFMYERDRRLPRWTKNLHIGDVR